ncbi:glycosyltransferase family 2 protein [Marinimicrobium sp. C2-29]|uniref:glycosyltransferase family 2 protein n=1 Tax=Marinimicrobium sp. C2-29 TaxID=3139825 RepID=UPI003138646D
MKLKEIPGSLLTALRLKWLRLGPLHQHTDDPIPVIVSLTSIPSRLPIIHLTIRSLLAQRRKPELVVLWLNERLRGQLPAALTRLEGPLFSIRFADMDCPHRKLVHARAAFPGKTIVTCDDDLMYDDSWLQRLYADHEPFPDAVIAHECRYITRDAAGELLPYKQWPTALEPGVSAPNLMPIGYGGVLFPPESLDPRVDDREQFLALTPRADDLWFKAMAHLRGTVTRRSRDPGRKPTPIGGSQKVSLKKTNVRQDGNRETWQTLCDHFGINI